ncbi:MAG: alpha/beta fold hydrolase, partial [Gammaproteobacteria bacterium]|nr:alpha/beta fold hydrolase [Gammaproteobacteria bacterium]
MTSAIVLLAIGLLVAVLIAYFVFPKHLATMLLHGLRGFAGFKARSIDIAGVTWPYLEGGPKFGDVVILLHGFGGDKDNWPLYARFLRRAYRVIIPDLPGFGENAKDPGADYGMDAQAERLHSFV